MFPGNPAHLSKGTKMNALTKLRRRLRTAYKHLKRTVLELCRRLLNEPGYADTAANFVACGVELFCRNRGLVGLVREAAQAIAVVVRASIRGRRHDNDQVWLQDPAWAM